MSAILQEMTKILINKMSLKINYIIRIMGHISQGPMG